MRTVLLAQPARGEHRGPGARVPRGCCTRGRPHPEGVRRPRHIRHIDRQARRLRGDGRRQRLGRLGEGLRIQDRPLRPQPIRQRDIQGEAQEERRAGGLGHREHPGRARRDPTRGRARGHGGVLLREPGAERAPRHAWQRAALHAQRRERLRLRPRPGRSLRGERHGVARRAHGL